MVADGRYFAKKHLRAHAYIQFNFVAWILRFSGIHEKIIEKVWHSRKK